MDYRLRHIIRVAMEKAPLLRRVGRGLERRLPDIDGVSPALRQMGTIFAAGLTDGGAMDRQMASWLKGVNGELRFWLGYLLEYGAKGDRFGQSLPLAFPMMLPHLHTGSRVLDCGASMASTIGDTLPNGDKIELVPVDPLAPFYDRLLAGFGAKPYATTRFGLAEFLDDIFAPGSFDMACMCNSLDHSYDPIAGVKQLLNMVSKGGHVFLCHNRNEAERENYRGFHQWNLDADGESFVIRDKDSRRNVTAMLQDVAEVRVELEDIEPEGQKTGHDQVISVLMEKSTDALFDLREEKAAMLSFLVRALGAMAISVRGNVKGGGLITILGAKAPR